MPSKICNKDWNYEYHGKDWTCGCKGKYQSPCNLPTNIGTGEVSLEKVQFN